MCITLQPSEVVLLFCNVFSYIFGGIWNETRSMTWKFLLSFLFFKVYNIDIATAVYMVYINMYINLNSYNKIDYMIFRYVSHSPSLLDASDCRYILGALYQHYLEPIPPWDHDGSSPWPAHCRIPIHASPLSSWGTELHGSQGGEPEH